MSEIVTEFIALNKTTLDELLVLKQKPIDAVPTPLEKWNQHCGDFGGGVGLARSWHVTVGANTGAGKSIKALNIAWRAAEHGEKPGFISLEMSWEQLATRYMAIVSGENIRHLEPGPRLRPYLHRQAAQAIEELRERTGGELITNERHISKLEDVTDAIRYLAEYEGCRLVIVDYVQLVKTVRAGDLLDSVMQISAEVRRAAQELKIVTVGLSQLNREASKNYEESPTPQSLMGGSPLENDSDQVLLIDHSTYRRNPILNTATQQLLLGKNRHGATAKINCQWNYDTLRISQTEPELPASLPQSERVEPERKPPELKLAI